MYLIIALAESKSAGGLCEEIDWTMAKEEAGLGRVGGFCRDVVAVSSGLSERASMHFWIFVVTSGWSARIYVGNDNISTTTKSTQSCDILWILIFPSPCPCDNPCVGVFSSPCPGCDLAFSNVLVITFPPIIVSLCIFVVVFSLVYKNCKLPLPYSSIPALIRGD